MKRATEIRGVAELEDSYCRVRAPYKAFWAEEDWWEVVIDSLDIFVISSTGKITQSLTLPIWQRDRALGILEPRLEVEARKDISRQLLIEEEEIALRGLDYDNY